MLEQQEGLERARVPVSRQLVREPGSERAREPGFRRQPPVARARPAQQERPVPVDFRRRLTRLLAAIDADVEGSPVPAREHVVARLADLTDAGVTLARSFRP